MKDWLRPLLLMFCAPVRGMEEVRDHVPLGRAVLLGLLLQVAHTLYAQSEELARVSATVGAWAAVSVLFTSAGSVLLIGLVFVPAAVLCSNLFGRRAGFGLVLRQEYAPLAAACFYALAAACLLALPLAFAAKATGLTAWTLEFANSSRELLQNLPPEGPTEEQTLWMAAALPRLLLVLAIQPLCLFGLWAVAAVRAVFRLEWWRAALAVLLSHVLMLFASPLLLVFSTVLASPFLLLLIFFLVRGYVGEAVRSQRARAAFRQNLEAATLNPADATAHYHLGLIHQERKELDEARARFLRAVEIDPEETDAHYQLGRIARAENRLPDAINHFGEVVARDQTHAQHEVWREAGAAYLAAAQYEDAEEALRRFLEHRPSDPEALYLMGRVHSGLGRQREAKEWMQRCVEAVRTAPAYKYRADKRWLNEAQQFLRTQA